MKNNIRKPVITTLGALMIAAAFATAGCGGGGAAGGGTSGGTTGGGGAGGGSGLGLGGGGGGAGGTSGGGGGGGTSYFPLTAGRTWNYTAGGQTIVWAAKGQTTFQGATALELDMGPNAATANTQEYFANTASGLAVIGENQAIETNTGLSTLTYANAPAELFLQTNLTAGYTFTEKYVQTAVGNPQSPGATQTNLTTTILIVGYETVTVPAGTFTNALHIRDTDTAVFDGESTTTVADDWLVQGVGVVKSINGPTTPTTIELVSYTQ